MLRALIFDFDGLILDTETSSYETARVVWADHGAELTLAAWQLQIGTHRRHWIDELEDIVGPIPERDVVLEHRRLAHNERLLSEVALPGVHDFVLAAHRAGVRLAVASSSTFGWVSTHLERLELLDYFDAIVNCEGGIPAKPAPDVYEAAVAALEVGTAEAIAFEDSSNGIAAAKAAGLVCVAVPNRMTAALDLRAADLLVDSFVELDLDALASLL